MPVWKRKFVVMHIMSLMPLLAATFFANDNMMVLCIAVDWIGICIFGVVNTIKSMDFFHLPYRKIITSGLKKYRMEKGNFKSNYPLCVHKFFFFVRSTPLLFLSSLIVIVVGTIMRTQLS